jgi:hypothetical protein
VVVRSPSSLNPSIHSSFPLPSLGPLALLVSPSSVPPSSCVFHFGFLFGGIRKDGLLGEMTESRWTVIGRKPEEDTKVRNE